MPELWRKRGEWGNFRPSEKFGGQTRRPPPERWIVREGEKKKKMARKKTRGGAKRSNEMGKEKPG